MKILIIGGVAGGATTATRLRRLDEEAQIILFERGEHVSFANCGLPYYIGNQIKKEQDLLLQTPKSFLDKFQIDVRVSNEVIKINKEKKEIEIKNLTTGEIYQENYDILVLSPGAAPIKPNIEIEDETKVFTLRNVNDTLNIKQYIDKHKPQHVTIIGGGYIGIEMLENLHHIGIKVTVVEKGNHILGPLDTDMANYVTTIIKEKGIDIQLETEVKAIHKKEDKLEIVTDKDSIITDFVISAIGVMPESKLAKEAGLSLNQRGSIIVDNTMKTSDAFIYALGDAVAMKHFVTGKETFIPLAGPANKQARVVANNIVGIKTTYEGTQGSSILKLFDYTIANTGINEFTAKNEKIEYDKIYLAPFHHATYYPGAEQLITKVLFEKKTGIILGAQIIGKQGVDKRCDVLAIAIRLRLKPSELSSLELCYAPPYSSAKDSINIIGNMIENILDGLVKQIHVEEIDVAKDIIIDVREKEEVENGMIEHAIHIPLNTVRTYLKQHTFDKTKRIIIYCQSGLRSYSVCRILESQGYEAYNLSGGYQIYQISKNKKDS